MRDLLVVNAATALVATIVGSWAVWWHGPNWDVVAGLAAAAVGAAGTIGVGAWRNPPPSEEDEGLVLRSVRRRPTEQG